MRLLLITLLTASTSYAFFMGSNCGCPQPSCPPPQPCAPPPCGGRPCVHGTKTEQVEPIAVPQQVTPVLRGQPLFPDELQLRATAFGIPLEESKLPTNIDQLERLADRRDTQLRDYAGAPIPTYHYKEEDSDLFAGLRRNHDIRRAPTVSVKIEDGTTSAPTLVEAETTPAPEAPAEASEEPTQVKGEEEGPHPPAETKCNSQILRKLMQDNMSDNSSESKRKINVAAETKFGDSVDVICSRGHFSYVFSSNLYCETTKGLTTCIAFRQPV